MQVGQYAGLRNAGRPAGKLDGVVLGHIFDTNDNYLAVPQVVGTSATKCPSTQILKNIK